MYAPLPCRAVGLAFRVLLLAPPPALATPMGAGALLAGALGSAGYRTLIDPALTAQVSAWGTGAAPLKS